MTTTPQPTTPAAELRSAAEKIRNTAKEANQESWCPDYAYAAIRHVERNCDIECETHEGDGENCHGFGMYAGPYVAVFATPTGLACAELLDRMARDMEANAGVPGPGWTEALTIARLINGSAS